MTRRSPLWLFVGSADDPAAPYVSSTLARLAGETGVLFEQYLENPREGTLFARTVPPCSAVGTTYSSTTYVRT